MFLDLFGVGGRFINLIDGKDDGHIGSHSVVDGLFGLRHDVVVGSHDDDGDVGDLGTAGTHGSECLMTRGIEEGDMTAIVKRHVVGTDVLRDTTGLTGDNISPTDIVEQ